MSDKIEVSTHVHSWVEMNLRREIKALRRYVKAIEDCPDIIGLPIEAWQAETEADIIAEERDKYGCETCVVTPR